MTTTPQGSNRFQLLVESMCRSLDQGKPPNTEDFRQFCTQLQTNVAAALPGGNWIVPGGTKASGAAAPTGVGFSVTGKNGVYTATVTNPSGGQGGNIWHEISYGPLKSFSTAVQTLPPSVGTSFSLSLPGGSFFFRLRSSYDLANWSDYQLAAQSAITSGLVSSAATSEAGAFNQTNFGVVTSVAIGSTAAIQVSGPSAPLTNLVRQKGPAQTTLPGATILGITPSSDQFVGFDGSKYVVRNTLAALLADDGIIPIGKVSVVGTGVPVLPVVTPIISGGHIIGTSWTPGSGLSAPPTLTVSDPGGPGADGVVICTGVEGGEMTGVQVLNAGHDYDGSTIITASGGIFPGTTGGGTAAGTNGGRLTNV